MFAKRIIPCLDCKDGRVVKGVQFVNLRDAGDPGELAAMYNSEGADELVMLDISASREGRATLMDTVNRVARRLFIPLTVGGGVRTTEDARRLLTVGADKVAINTAAVENPEIVQQLAAPSLEPRARPCQPRGRFHQRRNGAQCRAKTVARHRQ